MRRNKYCKGNIFGKWTLKSYIGAGGNAEVWLSIDKDRNEVALKLLSKLKDKSYRRFCDEIKSVTSNMDIDGVLPIYEYHLPENLIDDVPWYTMPIAKPIYTALNKKNKDEVIEAIISIGWTLSHLHERGISHRDIKPGNLYLHHDEWKIADFGLVDYPGKQDLTNIKESVGPKWTIAPEMRREAAEADGMPADVYSLAKTLWILLTAINTGFDGQYSEDIEGIGLKSYCPTMVLPLLNKLLREATDNNPANRPTMTTFTSTLVNWFEINKDFEKGNLTEWLYVINKLFPISTPSRAYWSRLEDIISVLELLSSTKNLNHMFHPDYGGQDLNGVSQSVEKGCIELNCGGLVNIVKPKRLIFESFGDDIIWNYFRLETDFLKASGIYKDLHFSYEELVEIAPGRYINADGWEQGYYSDEPHSGEARRISRYIKGDFVIFLKTSIYNKIDSTYDGRHNKMTSDAFRTYIEEAIKYLKNKR